jgi:hypothetical protein
MRLLALFVYRRRLQSQLGWPLIRRNYGELRKKDSVAIRAIQRSGSTAALRPVARASSPLRRHQRYLQPLLRASQSLSLAAPIVVIASPQKACAIEV